MCTQICYHSLHFSKQRNMDVYMYLIAGIYGMSIFRRHIEHRGILRFTICKNVKETAENDANIFWFYEGSEGRREGSFNNNVVSRGNRKSDFISCILCLFNTTLKF
jgi:hypothetical protein